MRVLQPNQPAQQIDQIVPFSVVFDSPTATALRVPVLDPATGIIMMMAPPIDLLQELSSQIYGLTLRSIGYDNRKFYQGIREDDGWQLVRHLRTSQADEGGHYDLLDSQRSSLACSGFADYPAFEAAVLQLKTDFDHAVATGLIRPDEAWPLSQAKNLVSDLLTPLLGTGLADWVLDPANAHVALEGVFDKASSLYKVRVRQMRNKRNSAQQANVTGEPPASDPDAFYYNPDSSDARDRNARDDKSRSLHQRRRTQNGKDSDSATTNCLLTRMIDLMQQQQHNRDRSRPKQPLREGRGGGARNDRDRRRRPDNRRTTVNFDM